MTPPTTTEPAEDPAGSSPRYPIAALDQRDPAVARAIHQTLQAAYRVEAALIGATDFPPLARSEDSIRASGSLFRGCRDGERLAAVIELETARDLTVVASLAVRPDYARRGLGRALVSDALARSSGPVAAATGRDNHPAVALYLGCGFEIVEESRAPEGIVLVHLRHAGPGAP